MNNRLESFIYTAVWLLVVLVTIHLWTEGVPEIIYEMNAVNLGISFVAYAVCLFGLIYRKIDFSYKFRSIDIYLIESLSAISLFVLWLFFGFFIIGILFSLYLVKLASLVNFVPVLSAAILLPIIFAAFDFYTKGVEFGFESIALYSAFNCVALLYTFNGLKLLNEKNEVKKLFAELKATQILLNENIRRDERLRIARDLHDSLGHNLTALNIQLEIASHVDSDATGRCIDKAKVISQFLLADVRRAVTDFRQSLNGGLLEALLKLKENITDIEVDIKIELDEAILDSSHLELIFRCTQESLTNSMRHSNATRCSVTVGHSDSELTFLAEDNGCITKPPVIGNGLRGIKERISRFDGEMFFNWSEAGFSLGFSIPFDRG